MMISILYDYTTIKYIEFPFEEHNDLKDRLDNKKFIVSTRVDREYGKYKKGDILRSNLGENYILKVIDVKQYTNLKDHPFYDEIKHNKTWIDSLKPYNKYEVIWMTKDTITK